MFSTRTSSSTQETTTDNTSTTTTTTPTEPVIPPTEYDGIYDGSTGCTGGYEPDDECIPTYIPMNLQVIPQLEVTVCKPRVVIKNKAICKPNCKCEDDDKHH